MPQLPSINAPLPVAQSNRGVSTYDGTQVARANAQIGQAIGGAVTEFADKAIQKQDRYNFAMAKSSFLKSQIEAENELDQDQDYATYAKRYGDKMTKARDQAIAMVTSPSDRALFQQDLDLDIQRGLGVVARKAKNKETDVGRGALMDTIATNREIALQSTDDEARASVIKSTTDAIEGAKDRGYLTEQEAVKMRKGATEDYALASVRMLEPAARLDALSKPGIVDLIPTDKRAELKMQAENQVEVEHRRLQAEADRIQQRSEMNALRAEAKGERTLGKINAQISSGIPATEDMWRQWGSQVEGTPAQAEFKDLIKQEADTQKILRLPIDQQIAEINTKTAKLQTEGGTIADATNLNRLSKAVEASAKMMSDAPLDYFQQRLGGDVTPIDLSSPNLGAALTDRVSAIQGMQEKFGSTVAMKPLLPQEAKQISAQLAEMSPDQQSQLFATLHDAMGDDKAYSGAMQQIAPDSPIRALTGLLAGKQRSMVAKANWFKPDDIVTSGDVAKTMALGESILNKSKTEKGSDGKGASFPLPKQADFQLELSKQLGSVFAGQPQSYQLAAQAVKSYYTGAAAESGNVSGEIDRGLLRQAIKASVGEVVDFNGGKTLAPWGMPAHTFRDVATDRLVGTMKAQGMSEADISTADALTLRQYKDGIYYVMQGQQFKYGADGKPLMVNVNEDAQ